MDLRRNVLRLHHALTGRRVLSKIGELGRTQWLDKGELLELQRKRCRKLAEYAYFNVPYYQRLFDQAGFEPRELDQDLDSLSKLPFLTREIIRENFPGMLTVEKTRRRRMIPQTTSGSTGEPLLFREDTDFRDSATADLQRHLSWAGLKLGECHAYIWILDREANFKNRLRARLVDWTWNRFLVDSFDLTEEAMPDFAAKIQRKQPKILFGYPASLHRFARYVRESPYREMSFAGVFATAEILLPAVRVFLEETFRCKVFDRYASMEMGGIACECEAHDGLHVSVENVFVEIIGDDGHPAQPGQSGEIIVTNLQNLGMPFFRYVVGDRGAWAEDQDCPCGRRSPRLKLIEGRIVDTFLTSEGKKVCGNLVDRNLAHPSIKKFQVIQKSLDRVVVRIAPDGKVPPALLQGIVRDIRSILGGSIGVEFVFVEDIPVPPSGKNRYSLSEVSQGQKWIETDKNKRA